MGVQGLYTFMLNSGFLKPCSFRDSKLIIDGANFFNLFYSSSGLDQSHGGDYESFQDLLTEFFDNLTKCGIEPYVVFDGGNDVSDKKLDTLMERSRQRIREAYSLSLGQTANVRLTLTEEVFVQILRKLGVPFIQCLNEADWELAALANEWNCPILSGDSDFYIFGNNGGLMPITHFEWKTPRGTTQHFISAKRFVVEDLCAAYNNMNKDHLHLFANILGNDYVNLKQRVFQNWAMFSRKPGKAAKIDGLLRWLSRYPDPKGAITALMSLQGQNSQSAGIRETLSRGMEEYGLRPSTIAKFFLRREPQSKPPGPLEKLPDWILLPFAEGRLNAMVINTLMLKRNRLNCQVEDFKLSSTNVTSKYIRQVTYGILLCTSRTGGGGGGHQVEEYDREGLDLVRTMVPAVLPKCAERQLCLDALWETSHPVCLQVLLDTLSVSPLSGATPVPNDLHLGVYVTSFWMRNAQPEPKEEMLWALLVGLVYGQLCKEHRSQRGVNVVIERLRNLKASQGRMRNVDLRLAHAYSQWQKCLRHGYELNQLLNQPVPEPELARLYSGPLLHRVARELMTGVNPESLLTESSLAVELYRKLQAAVKQIGMVQEDQLAQMLQQLKSHD